MKYLILLSLLLTSCEYGTTGESEHPELEDPASEINQTLLINSMVSYKLAVEEYIVSTLDSNYDLSKINFNVVDSLAVDYCRYCEFEVSKLKVYTAPVLKNPLTTATQ